MSRSSSPFVQPVQSSRSTPPPSYIRSGSSSPVVQRSSVNHDHFAVEAGPSRPTTPRPRSPQVDPHVEVLTAPTTPNGTRIWIPTPNVPLRIRQPRSIDEDDRNRWLSEDEGLGSSRSGGRSRRNRQSRGDDHGGNDDENPRPGKHRDTSITRSPKLLASPSRPRVRRVQSSDIARRSPSTALPIESRGVGSGPPSIHDLVPPPSRVPIPFIGGIERMTSSPGQVPDFARGRGGDGIGGISLPLNDETEVLDVEEVYEKRLETVGKLRRILGCALCPSTNSPPPPLHHPITLPCGHTLSASHVSIPAPPPLILTSNLPHDIAAAQQRQHQQRLGIWVGIMCPIPSCKRHSPLAGQDITSISRIPGTLASGVTYYPPPPPPPPPSASTLTEATSPLLDISVDKILHLVLREMVRLSGDQSGSEQLHTDRLRQLRHGSVVSDAESVDTSHEEDEADAIGPSSSSTTTFIIPSLLGDSEADDRASVDRSSSKRRRDTRISSRDSLPTRSRPPPATDNTHEWSFQKELLSVVECDVCALLLYEPVTTPCQHTFCSKCLSRSLDHSSRCPLCRQDLPSFAFFQDHAVNKVILSVIKTAFPAEYSERQASIERDERDARLDTPIFVCTLAFPGMPTILHVFEPRYRLMIRRAIESSSPRFGMVLPARGSGQTHLQGVMEYGTMLEIQSVQMLPDGRSMVETVGTHRFRLVEKGNLDGYTVGRVERIDDISPEDEAMMERDAVARARSRREAAAAAMSSGSPMIRVPTPSVVSLPTGRTIPTLPEPTYLPLEIPPPPNQSPRQTTATPPPLIPIPPSDETPQTTEELMQICRNFIDQLRSGSAPWLLQRLNNTYGSMPTDPSEFSYWMALVIPIDEYEKARLLPIRSPRLRLKLIVHWVESLRSSWWFSSG